MMPLSPAQRGIWAGAQLVEDKALYNTAECLFFSGKIDAVCLESSIRQVVGEAENLCSYYQGGRDGRGVRVPMSRASVQVVITSVHGTDSEDLATYVHNWAKNNDLPKPFFLDRELPCRFVIFENDKTSALYMASHHIALDGFAYTLFWDRLATVYTAKRREETPPACSFHPAECLVAEQSSPDARIFWLQKLSQTKELVTLSHPLPPLTRGYTSVLTSLANDVWMFLNQYSANHRLTWADVMIANLALLLRVRTGASEIVLGLPIMNRTTSEELQTPGMQMNIVPLCLEIADGDELITLARKVNAEKKAMRKYQGYRYEAMQRDLQTIAPREHLFGAVINILPFAAVPRFENLDGHKEVMCAGPVVDFALTVHYQSPKIAPKLEFSGHQVGLPAPELQSLADEFHSQMMFWLTNPSVRVEEIVETKQRRERAKHIIFDHDIEQPTLNVIDRIAEQACCFPTKLALEQGDSRLTYAELMDRVETWARALVGEGLQPGDPVAVGLERSIESIVALLAVMRAGGCYVPLDLKQSVSRRRQLGALLDIKFAISASGQDFGLPEVRHFNSQQLDQGSNNLSQSHHELAYILFTSGSTGEPKGVAITHEALSFFITAANERYQLTADDRVLQFAPLFFDTSLEEIFLTLCHGATLVLRDDAMLDSFESFAHGVKTAAITVLDLPTAYWSEWVEALVSGYSSIPSSVRTVIIGGEGAHPDKLKKWFAAAGSRQRLINSYGPTEATIVATTIELKEEHARMSAVPIGLPLPGLRLLLLDRAGCPAEEGELCILGPTVGARYFGHQGALHTLLRVGDEVYRAYRTGDRARLIHNTIVYLGRMDHEFKISGYRIQPREVEARLLAITGVSEACVVGLIEEQGRRRLVAFVAGPNHLEPEILRRTLNAHLPRAMVPGVFVISKALPKTSAGKIDRAALIRDYEANRGSISLPTNSSCEAVVRAAWQDVLALTTIDAQDDFFAMGGDSLQAMQVALHLSQQMGQTITIADVMEHPRFNSLCNHLEKLLVDPLPRESLRLVELNHVPGLPTAYFFPGIWATASQFSDLVPHLATKMNIIVVEASLLGFSNMGEWASAALELLETKCGQEPIRLVGHSFGGCVAYEVGRLLQERGLKVELCLLDAYFQLDRASMSLLVHDRNLEPLLLYRPHGSFHGWTRRIYASTASHFTDETLTLARNQDNQLFTGGGDIRETSGDHFSMLSGEHAASLGKLMPWM